VDERVAGLQSQVQQRLAEERAQLEKLQADLQAKITEMTPKLPGGVQIPGGIKIPR
jgi:hypothetical protein